MDDSTSPTYETLQSQGADNGGGVVYATTEGDGAGGTGTGVYADLDTMPHYVHHAMDRKKAEAVRVFVNRAFEQLSVRALYTAMYAEMI